MPSAFQLARVLWVAVFVLWIALAFRTKRTEAFSSNARVWVAVLGVMLAWQILFNPGLHRGLLAARILPMNRLIDGAGLALTAAGLGFAVWARFAIGRNWGSMITVKQDHELMRTGPYAIVRHPIYSGLILATLGTAIIVGELGGLVSVALITISWGHKAGLEESFMIEQFGAEYEEYRRGTKRLIPGVW